ncbi:armadillo repeat-containing protein gudu isoform X2 [Bemisia tabaci]|uniref:armadillo repeat-containing protein gudu isoform X2 n=1 Tax=Bemisia tabaci TaxID=7038 RepID=UPI003B28ABF0
MSQRVEEDEKGQTQLGPREVYVEELPDNDDSSVCGGSSDEEDEDRWKDARKQQELPSEYWHIQKLIKYMKAGNQTATVIALVCLKDQDLTQEMNQEAIREIGGLEVLVNLLETNDFKCKLGALSILSQITASLDTRRTITDLGGIPLLVRLLYDPSSQLQMLAAETIANTARIRKARKIVRKKDGIPKLVDLLDVPQVYLGSSIEELDQEKQDTVAVVRGSSKALWSLSKSQKNREVMRKAGCVKLLARLLRSVHEDIVLPVIGTIQQCASESKYQLAIQTEGIVEDLVRYLSSPNDDLKTHAASAIFKCAEDMTTRNAVRQHGGLDPLVGLIKSEKTRSNQPLLAACTGAVWKCAISPDNVRRLDELRTVNTLVGLLAEEDEQVLTNVVGALAECAKLAHNRDVIRKVQGIPPLVNLLNLTNQPLLENTTRVLGECAWDSECMAEIEEMDGVRLIWSLLKNDSPKVQAEAAWALVPCVQNAKNSGELVRSFVGGLELMVRLLYSPDNQVLACVCAAIAKVAQDRENLAVISDHGVVQMLSHLVKTRAVNKQANKITETNPDSSRNKSELKQNLLEEEDDDNLREHLAAAIANCCNWSTNCHEFGRLGAVTSLVEYMISERKQVHRTTALALANLSQDPFNCITLHQSRVVPVSISSFTNNSLNPV